MNSALQKSGIKLDGRQINVDVAAEKKRDGGSNFNNNRPNNNMMKDGRFDK